MTNTSNYSLWYTNNIYCILRIQQSFTGVMYIITIDTKYHFIRRTITVIFITYHIIIAKITTITDTANKPSQWQLTILKRIILCYQIIKHTIISLQKCSFNFNIGCMIVSMLSSSTSSIVWLYRDRKQINWFAKDNLKKSLITKYMYSENNYL